MEADAVGWCCACAERAAERAAEPAAEPFSATTIRAATAAARTNGSGPERRAVMAGLLAPAYISGSMFAFRTAVRATDDRWMLWSPAPTVNDVRRNVRTRNGGCPGIALWTVVLCPLWIVKIFHDTNDCKAEVHASGHNWPVSDWRL